MNLKNMKAEYKQLKVLTAGENEHSEDIQRMYELELRIKEKTLAKKLKKAESQVHYRVGYEDSGTHLQILCKKNDMWHSYEFDCHNKSFGYTYNITKNKPKNFSETMTVTKKDIKQFVQKFTSTDKNIRKMCEIIFFKIMPN